MRVAVIGAGIIGLACAEELLRAGHDVRVFDPTPARGATYAAAGMLAPEAEAWHGESALLRLGLASAAMWRGYAARLGPQVDYRPQGTVLVGHDHDDLRTVHRCVQLLREHDLAAGVLSRRALREAEPTVSSRTAGGVLLPDDHQVNPRRVAEALLARVGDRLVRERATQAAGGVVTGAGTAYPADVVVEATGTAAAHTRPVRGEILRTRMDDPPARVVRGWVHGWPVYLVPRAGGEVVVGATEEEHAGEPVPTVGGVARILDAARRLVPGVDRAEILEVLARDRPGTPDNGPLIGPVTDGRGTRIVAAGHYRSGVLLAPVTAQAVRAHVEGTPVPDVVLPFLSTRFELTIARRPS